MTTILSAFIVAFCLALALTPVARWLGVRLGAIDTPSERKVHTRDIPRSGGLAILASFVLALAFGKLLSTDVSRQMLFETRHFFAALGAIVAFSIGFFDDMHRLGPRIKFLSQILAATLAFHGGVRIDALIVDDIGIYFGFLSWAVTVFWFLLFINAVNLIDGLDGLAAGVTFFTSAVMVALLVMQNNFVAALEFAALGGALLGFLRYNFNPASIFMGDGGSYFVGYAIAAIAILGSIKSQVGATLLIPLLALGVPIFDTLLSPLRRWLLGKRMFQPDKEHIHHRLLKLGFSTHRVVLLIYGVSFALCAGAILLANYRNEMVGLLLIVLGAGSMIVVRKLGYLDYFATDKILGWFRDISDASGLSHDRRSFLNLQMEIEQAGNMDELWMKLCLALEMLRFDRAELHMGNHLPPPGGAARPAFQTVPAGVAARPTFQTVPTGVAAHPAFQTVPTGTAVRPTFQTVPTGVAVEQNGEGASISPSPKPAARNPRDAGPSPTSPDSPDPATFNPGDAGPGSLNPDYPNPATFNPGDAGPSSLNPDYPNPATFNPGDAGPGPISPDYPDPAAGGSLLPQERRNGARAVFGRSIWTREEKNGHGSVRVWARGNRRRREDALGETFFRIEFPLAAGNPVTARLVLLKDPTWDPFHPYTMRRVEYLRRSMLRAIIRLRGTL